MDKKEELATACQTCQTLQTELRLCKRTIEIMREELELYTAIFKAVGTSTVVLDDKGNIVRCNQACLQAIGYTFDEVSDRPFWELFSTPEQKEVVKVAFEQIQVDKLAILHENNWVTKNGSCCHLAWSSVPLLDADGSVKYIVSTGNNIVERKRAEEALYRLQEELQAQVQERTRELAQANQALLIEVEQRQRAEQVSRGQIAAVTQTLKALTDEPDLDKFLEQVLIAITEQLNVFSSALYFYDFSEDTSRQHMSYYKGQVLTAKQQLGHPVAQKPVPIDRTHPSWQEQHINHRPAVVDLLADTSFVREPREWREWLLAHGVKTLLLVPLILGDEHLGTFSFRFTERRPPTAEEIELAQALAHQATLAIQLTRLTEQARLAARQRQEELELRVQERTVELAKANVAMMAEVTERQAAELIARGQTEVLTRTLNLLATESDLDKFLGQVLKTITGQLNAPMSTLWLYDAATKFFLLHMTCDAGHIKTGPLQLGDVDVPLTLPLNVLNTMPVTQEALRTGRPGVLDDIANNLQTVAFRSWLLARGVLAILVVPLLLGKEIVGVLDVQSNERDYFQPKEIALAQALAHQVSLAVQLTRLAEQAKQAAVVEERNRLAREIHDTLAQAFTGIVVHQEAAKRILTAEQEEVQEHISWTLELAREGLEEARRSVWALRAATFNEGNLPDTLARTVEQMTGGLSIEAMFGIRGIPRSLPEEVESNLLRIAQEALTNALKHSLAHHIYIELIFENQQVRLRVQDDGQGFMTLPSATAKSSTEGGFGLIGMQERTKRLGGQLTITSQPKKGTEVVVALPLLAS